MGKQIHVDDKPIELESKDITLKQFYKYIEKNIYPDLSDKEIDTVKAQMKIGSEIIYIIGRDVDSRAYPSRCFKLK